MEQVIESLASGLGNSIAWLAENGVLFGIFAIIWIAFAAGLIWSQGSLDQAWNAIRNLPLVIQVVVWVLFLPVMIGLWIWETSWPLVVRLVLVVGVADVPAQGVAGRTAIARSEIDMSGRYVPVLVGVSGLAAAVYALVIRPWMLGWGSTFDEQTRPLPGDGIEPAARYVTTRATTIQAPAAAVWPWLIQMGHDRAGFYTHNWVERLLRSGIPDTAEIRAEWQRIEVGDLVRTNHDIGGKPMGWPVVQVDPGRSLVLISKGMPAGTYAFVVEPIDEGASRLIVRDRARWKWWEWPFSTLVYEPLHAYMETGLISGVRQRAERARSEPAAGPS